MAVTDPVEAFLAEKTGLPLEQVSRIYRAGSPWPLLSQQLDRKVELYAQAHGVTFGQACAVIEAESIGEEARLMELLAAVQAAQGKPDFDEKMRACFSCPILREMRDHSQRVASLIGENLVIVLTLHFALHNYTMEHPDWDPAPRKGLC